MCDTETRTSKMNMVLKIFAIGLPFAYLTGYLYRQGYLSAYGLSADAFLNTPEYYLVHFFIALSMPLLWGLNKVIENAYAFLVLFLFLVFVTFVFVHYEKTLIDFKLRLKDKVKAPSKKPWFLKLFLPVAVATTVTSATYIAFLTVGSGILICYTGYYVGHKVGQDQLDELPCGAHRRCQRLLVKGQDKGIGYVIALSDKFIAFRNSNGVEMLQNENIELKVDITVSK